MSELTISSTHWLAISFRNGAAIVFNLKKADQWQYLTPPSAANTQAVAAATTPAEDDDDNATDLNRNLIRFTPNGRMLAINGQNKQISIYTSSGNATDNLCWELKRIINVKKRASAFDLTNDLLLIADKSGDVYR
jgi:WD40 repeat protein